MLEQKILAPKTKRSAVRDADPAPPDPQRRLMVVALVMLLVALGFVFYRDRDFWFPAGQTQETELDATNSSAASIVATQPTLAISKTSAPSAKSKHAVTSKKKTTSKTPVLSEPAVP